MTDARFPAERWLSDRRIQKLSGDDFKAYAMSLMWAVANRTDGLLTDEDLEAVPHFKPGQAQRLVAAGLWAGSANGWHIIDFMATQSSKASLDQADRNRLAEAERKRRERLQKKATELEVSDFPLDIRRDVHADIPRDAAQKPLDPGGFQRKSVRGPNPLPDKVRPMSGRTSGPPPQARTATEPGITSTSVRKENSWEWPTTEPGMKWRTDLDELGIDSLDGLMKHAGIPREQAQAVLAAAFPGRFQ